jgi:hypothetical protein
MTSCVIVEPLRTHLPWPHSWCDRFCALCGPPNSGVHSLKWIKVPHPKPLAAKEMIVDSRADVIAWWRDMIAPEAAACTTEPSRSGFSKERMPPPITIKIRPVRLRSKSSPPFIAFRSGSPSAIRMNLDFIAKSLVPRQAFRSFNCVKMPFSDPWLAEADMSVATGPIANTTLSSDMFLQR